ncbi:hypothetical protein H0H81_006404 [Sphagnurus paluster]|uniref:Uncharacterized protein n=1 Tax=Sphagnurus paluster TaxID=117069 RepID=A0A9P7G1I7_9AGAR|nr:hypothetical protein H0H81_006404 [Sphagnurus paluster]
MQRVLPVCLLALLASVAHAQTFTVVNAQTLTTASTTSLTTSSTSTTAPVTVTPPPVPEGPVGQPQATSFSPGGVTPYTYTTVVDGVTSVLVDNFTPTNPATQPITVGASGTILDYSSWLSQYGAQTTGKSGSGARAASVAGWQGVFLSGALAVFGGVLVLL